MLGLSRSIYHFSNRRCKSLYTCLICKRKFKSANHHFNCKDESLLRRIIFKFDDCYSTWRLKDLCYAPSVPNFDVHYIEQIFDRIIPCAIITPLDCFWEGSKLLGPEYPVHIPGRQNQTLLQWTNLNPTKMLDEMKTSTFNFPYKTLEEFMKRAGIGSGYQTKPCLDPLDHECPETSPNKFSEQVEKI